MKGAFEHREKPFSMEKEISTFQWKRKRPAILGGKVNAIFLVLFRPRHFSTALPGKQMSGKEFDFMINNFPCNQMNEKHNFPWKTSFLGRFHGTKQNLILEVKQHTLIWGVYRFNKAKRGEIPTFVFPLLLLLFHAIRDSCGVDWRKKFLRSDQINYKSIKQKLELKFQVLLFMISWLENLCLTVKSSLDTHLNLVAWIISGWGREFKCGSREIELPKKLISQRA